MTDTATPATDGKSKRRYMPPDVMQHDTVRRHLKRVLPVPLTREEFTDIAISAAKKRKILRQLEIDMAAEKKRRQQQIDELQAEIDTADRELDTGNQERPVMCNEIYFEGKVFTLRTDTWEAFEQRAANAQEAQRFLPAVEDAPKNATQSVPSGPPAVRATVTHAGQNAEILPPVPLTPAELAAAGGIESTELEPDADEPEDDGLTDLTPAQIAAKESAAARAKRRGEKNGGAK